MQLSGQPPKIELPLANAPTARAAIPATTPTGPGRATQQEGFPALTRTDPLAGGIPPDGLDMNGMLYLVSAVTRWLTGGGGFQYDSAWAGSTNVAGYPKGAELLDSAGLGRWLNLADGNTTNPDSGGENWVQTWLSGTTSTNGRIVMPVRVGSGYVNFFLQWATGVSTTTGDSTQTVPFPAAFPTACLHVVVTTLAGSDNLSDAWFQERTTTLTGTTVVAQFQAGGSVSGGVTPKIWAIGY